MAKPILNDELQKLIERTLVAASKGAPSEVSGTQLLNYRAMLTGILFVLQSAFLGSCFSKRCIAVRA